MSQPLGTPGPVPAVRSSAPGWRDPRLWVGIAIVALSVVAGARVIGAADDSVAVWAVTDDMGVGEKITSDDLVAHRVRFVEEAQLEGYFTSDEPLPAEAQLTRPVAAGELLPRAAVGEAGSSGTIQLPVAVDSSLVPPSVQAGDVVDVYLTGTTSDGAPVVDIREQARPVLSSVTVIEAPTLDQTFDATGRRQLVLAVEQVDVARYFRSVGRLDTPGLTVVGRA